MLGQLGRLLCIIALLCCCAVTLPVQDTANDKSPGGPYTLSIHVTGFRNNTGFAGTLIFCSPKGWPEVNDDACRHNSVPIVDREATLTFPGFNAGTYALVVIHDENKNKKMDKNFLGIPKEGFGFSNNPKVGLSAPSYEKATFTMDGDKTIEIKLIYK